MGTLKIDDIFICEWEIENFFMWSTQAIYTEFSAQSLCQSQWRLHLENNTDNNAVCSLERCEDSGDSKEIVVDCQIDIIGGSREILRHFILTEVYFNIGTQVENMIMNTGCLLSIFKPAINDKLTIVCIMRNRNTAADSVPFYRCKCKAKTKFHFDQHNLVVSVPLPIPAEPIISFVLDGVWLDAYIVTHENFTSVKLRFNSEFHSTVACQIGLLDACGNLKKFVEQSRLFLEFSEDWIFPTFFSDSELHNNEIYLIKNKFTLRFEFRYPSFAKTSKSLVYFDLPRAHESIDCLREDFLGILRYPLHTDVQLETDGKIYHAHKCVLAARSPVFRAIFERDTPENRNVDCTEVDSSTMAAFLEFLYAGIAEHKDCESSLKLMSAANRYGVSSLVEECSMFLQSVFTPDNVCSVIEVSNRIGHDNLKKAALSYVMWNRDIMLLKMNKS